MAVGMRHQLVGLLGRGIQTDRVVHVVALGKRHPAVATVNARTAGINEVLDRAVTTSFKDIGETDQIAVDVGCRIDQRIAYPGLRSQVNHALRSFGSEKLTHDRAVGNIGFDKTQTRMPGQFAQPGAFQRDIVVVIEVVNSEHFITTLKQAATDLATNKTGHTGKENFHAQGIPFDAVPGSGDFTLRQPAHLDEEKSRCLMDLLPGAQIRYRHCSRYREAYTRKLINGN